MSARAESAGPSSADVGRPLLATYRLQLRDGVGLRSARELVPYLHDLGVSHLYLSPIQRAVPGSTHGYDVTDPTVLDPELGTETDLEDLAGALHDRGMGLILDIVPNHVAAHTENPRWADVLRHGRASRWAHWFDIDWDAADGRVVLPVLGERLTEAIASGALRVDTDGANPPHLAYNDLRLPLRADVDAAAGDIGDVRSVLDRQHYRLVHWRRAGAEINYRRFFTINELAAVRQEDPRVFDETHARILKWLADDWIDGVRLDHVDGLLHPGAYLERLRAAMSGLAGARRTLHVEKILARAETWPAWPVEGTTGYDFVPEADDLFLDPRGYRRIEARYRTMLRRDVRFDALARSAKRRILRSGLLADVRRLVRMLDAGGAWEEGENAPADEEKQRAVIETIAAFPVYRTYPPGSSADTMRPEDRTAVQEAIEQARLAGVPDQTLDGLRRALLAGQAPDAGEAARATLLRFQQLCVPAAAKGVEDTAFYAWAALVCRNEVGADPDYGLEDAPAAFEQGATARAAHWPPSLLTVTTHDTKRAADVRARLAVLSEMADGWWRAVRRWRRWNRYARREVRGRLVPDANMEYLLYQTLVGAWPMDASARPVTRPEPGFAERIAAFMQKAAREAKQETAWIRRDERFEEALDSFVRTILEEDARSPFATDLLEIVGRVSRPGIWNSLSRCILHLTAPGVPDIYRGDELWFHALVDPDNRRPVDFDERRSRLESLDQRWKDEGDDRPGFAAGLLERAGDGDLKLHVITRALRTRRRFPGIFTTGDFARVTAHGAGADHVFAFTRHGPEGSVLVLAPRLVLTLTGPVVPPVSEVWSDTTVRIPSIPGGCALRCHLSGHTIVPELAGDEAIVRLAEALAHLPVALLEITPRSGA